MRISDGIHCRVTHRMGYQRIVICGATPVESRNAVKKIQNSFRRNGNGFVFDMLLFETFQSYSTLFLQQISDWIIDFNTPGGVDRDGWQYAVDFPASYHAKKQFTDYVRRRRWYRKCRLTTSGPWHEVGNTRIIDVCLQPQGDDAEYPIKVWAIASNGDALLRSGVNQSSFAGIAWQHITSHHALLSIGASQTYGIWAIGRNGSAYRRCHVTADNPLGEAWQTIDPPQGSMLKSISVGSAGIWAIDTRGQMVIRREITDAFPEGSHWQVLPNVVNDPPHEEGKIGFKSVSVTDEVWSVSVSGCVCKRSGVTKDNPAGTGWMLGISVSLRKEGTVNRYETH